MMDKDRWDRLLVNLHLNLEEVTYKKLLSAYSETHRAYHTAQHINDCLFNLDSNLDLIENKDAVECAIWFHDAIYRPYSKSNEEDSAKWAVDFLLSMDSSQELASVVSKLVIATKHNVPIHSSDESVLVDIDLAILGSEPKDYAKFEADIRFEYRKVPGFIFRKKRAKLLYGFLEREHIYGCGRFRDRYEAQAKKNIQWAVNALQR